MALVNHQFNLVSSKNTFMSYQSIDEGYPFDSMPVIPHTAIMTNNHKQTEKCQSSLNVDFSHENKFDSAGDGPNFTRTSICGWDIEDWWRRSNVWLVNAYKWCEGLVAGESVFYLQQNCMVYWRHPFQDRFKESGVAVKVIVAFGDESLSSIRHISYPLVFSFMIFSTVETLSATWGIITVLIGSKISAVERANFGKQLRIVALSIRSNLIIFWLLTALSFSPTAIINRPLMTIVFKFSKPILVSRSPYEDRLSAKNSHVYDVRFQNWIDNYSSNVINESVLLNLIDQVQGSHRVTHLMPVGSVESNLLQHYVSRNGLNSIEFTVPFSVDVD